MQTKCDASPEIFFLSNANAPWRRCKCKFFFDANVSLQRWRCECLLMDMSWCTCPFGYAVMRMSSCRYVMMQMLWCRHNSFKNSLYFQNEASSALETKTFSKLDLLFLKSHLPFDLRLPKNLVITVKNLWMRHWLRTWWSGSKDLFSQFGWAKRGGTFPRRFFLEKMNSLKIKYLKKIIF